MLSIFMAMPVGPIWVKERRQARKSFHHFFPSQHVSKLIKSAFQCAWRHHHKPLWVNIHFAIFTLSLAQFPCYTINNPSLNSDSPTETLVKASFTTQMSFNVQLLLTFETARCLRLHFTIHCAPAFSYESPFSLSPQKPVHGSRLIAALYLLINSCWQQWRVSGRINPRKPSKFATLWITFPFWNTHLSILMAHRLRMDAVQSKTSKLA